MLVYDKQGEINLALLRWNAAEAAQLSGRHLERRHWMPSLSPPLTDHQ